MNILPGVHRHQLAVIFDLRKEIGFHKDRDLAVCMNPNEQVLSKKQLMAFELQEKNQYDLLVHEKRNMEDRKILDIRHFPFL